MKKEYKFIEIFEAGHDENKRPYYVVNNKKSCCALGYIEWYGPWKQHVFNPSENAAFNNTCLRDIAGFMEAL